MAGLQEQRRKRRNVALGKPIGKLTSDDLDLLTRRERRWVYTELIRREERKHLRSPDNAVDRTTPASGKMGPMSQRSPAAERAYRSGRAAFRKGKDRGENPGHCASSRAADNYWAWFDGYDAEKTAQTVPKEDAA